MGRWAKSSCLLGVLIVSSCCRAAFAFLDSYDASDYDDNELSYFETFLDKGCQMEYVEEVTIGLENGPFHPVISLNNESLILIQTELNSYRLNTSILPLHRLMATRFIRTGSFMAQLSPFISFILTVEGASGNIKPKLMTFKRMDMTYNCTNGLPFYNGSAAFLVPGPRMELLFLSTQEGGDSAITVKAGWDDFYICTDGDIPFIGKGPNPTCVFSLRIPHLLTLHHDYKRNETKLNDTEFTDFTGIVSFSRGDYLLITCLQGCPSTTELNTPPGDVTKKVDKTCVFDRSNEPLLVFFSILILSHLFIDGGVMVIDYVYKRFFYQPPQQDPETLLWYRMSMGRHIPKMNVWRLPKINEWRLPKIFRSRSRPPIYQPPLDYMPEYLLIAGS